MSGILRARIRKSALAGWRWADNQESIEVMVLDSRLKSGWDKADIIVLTEDELILEQLIGEKQYRMEFTKK